MPEAISNASPLIQLAKIGQLTLLVQLHPRVLIPKAVCIATIALTLIFFPAEAFSQNRYGFLAGSDEKLLAKVQQPEYVAVVLACIYKIDPSPDPIGFLHISHATIIESYKGPLTVGQKITVVIASEGDGPTEEQELGRLRFFFLQNTHNSYSPKGAYACEGVDTAKYSDDYSERLRSLLRHIAGN